MGAQLRETPRTHQGYLPSYFYTQNSRGRGGERGDLGAGRPWAELGASDPSALSKQKPWEFSVPSDSWRSPCQPAQRAGLNHAPTDGEG